MAETPSTMLGIGTQAPDFALPEPATGNSVSLADFAGKPLLVVFSCNHCPYVLHILDSFTDFANEAQCRDLGVVMISANDVAGYPADGPEKMADLARNRGFEFPYLYDGASQAFSRAAGVSATPQVFVFSGSRWPIAPPVPRISSCSMKTIDWYTAGSTTARGQVTASRSTVAICAPRSTHCSPAMKLPAIRSPAWAAISSGNEPDYF